MRWRCSGAMVEYYRGSEEDLGFKSDRLLGAPPLSLLWIVTKEALIKAAESNSPLIADVYETLKDAPEDGRWTMLADPLDPDWVEEAEKLNSKLFFESIQQQIGR